MKRIFGFFKEDPEFKELNKYMTKRNLEHLDGFTLPQIKGFCNYIEDTLLENGKNEKLEKLQEDMKFLLITKG